MKIQPIAFIKRIVFLAILFSTVPAICLAKGGKVKNRIADLPMKTVCVGRFLIDIPVAFTISFGSAHIGLWDISSYEDESENDFTERLNARENELRVEKNMRDGRSLESVSVIRNRHVQGKIFTYDRVWNYYFERGKRIDFEGIKFLAMIHSKGKSYQLTTAISSDEDFARNNQLAHQIENWSLDKVPTQPGFCFGEGFIHEPLTINEHEFVMMYAGMEKFPDLSMAISTAAGINLNATLLARHAASPTAKKYASRFKSLGTGKREINGIRGEQVGDQVSELNGTTGYRFEWESEMEKENVLRPRILLELGTGTGRPGNPVNSSLSKDEILELWRKISSSIRERPEHMLNPSGSAGHEGVGNGKRDTAW